MITEEFWHTLNQLKSKIQEFSEQNPGVFVDSVLKGAKEMFISSLASESGGYGSNSNFDKNP